MKLSHSIISALLPLWMILPAQGQEKDVVDPATHQRLLKRVFGAAVELDRSAVEQVRSTHTLFLNPAGRPLGHNEAWFIDTDQRNPAENRPVLVRAIDEDDDMGPGQLPDYDSDLYIADWHADGTADVVIDYTDTDGDQDVDEMGMYFVGSSHNYFGEPVLRVWWAEDVGDDNLLIRDVAYNYVQRLCQWRSHFSGDETILAFAITEHGREWIPFWENPFEFYDHDGDGAAEEVLRLSGIDTDVEAYRHSFDAENDADAKNIHDYDVSVTAWAPGARWTRADAKPGLSDLKMKPDLTRHIKLRGIPTRPFVRHKDTPRFCEGVTWERAMLTWDENDNNIDNQLHEDRNERWEGIIAAGNPDFLQVGGPNTGLFNKRYELDMKPDGPVRLYYLPTDHRLHLFGADRGWIEVDYDYDEKADFRYAMSDNNHDGEFDHWTFDADLDGKPDDEWTRASDSKRIPYRYQPIHEAYAQALEDSLAPTYLLCKTLTRVAAEQGQGDFATQAWKDLQRQFSSESAGYDVARKLASSREALRFHLDVLKDRLLAKLRETAPQKVNSAPLASARSAGDIVGMVRALDGALNKDAALREARQDLAKFQLELVPADTATHVGYDDQWLPPNVAWESVQAAYRSYYGQFDFFGKSTPALILDKLKGQGTYHEETAWGMDALLVGNSPGCGGVTLYVDDKPYPAWSHLGKGDLQFGHRLISQSATLVETQLTIERVGPPEATYEIIFNCRAEAGHGYSPITVQVRGGQGSHRLKLGVGLTKLPQETLITDGENKLLGVWGAQSILIGYIGMGLILPSDREISFKTFEREHQAIFSIKPDEPVTYHLECAWLRGLSYTRSPGAPEWAERLRQSGREVRGTSGETHQETYQKTSLK